ncbi:hypothetical protein EXIGLDRAFT_844715 [Exidia glandulosa HHB12029]|uniref:ABM domain-containing protein n=1 Tax=Exidia glandulosa HHB12029 TaxID=1314781 RepID=A0A165ZBW3_EXIGL|nr:hypothetical protein EXIGLDRAFT_844715 [Exidia glandulosa HHB12029]
MNRLLARALPLRQSPIVRTSLHFRTMSSKTPITSEVLILRVSATDERFAALRRSAAQQGGATEQYYGEEKALGPFRPAKAGEAQPIVWVIQWPKTLPENFDKAAFTKEVTALDAKGAPETFITAFDDAALPRPALDAPLTEFATMVLDPAQISSPPIAKAIEKTFTDCYDAPDGGFTGGFWGPATSSNPEHDKLYMYYLGWENKQLHTKYSQTPLFALELENLAPATKNGWAIWVELKRATDL